FNARNYHGSDVGARVLGPLLAMGSQRNGRALLVDYLCDLHAFAYAQRVAGSPDRMGERDRVPFDHVLLLRRQHLDQRPPQLQALVALFALPRGVRGWSW